MQRFTQDMGINLAGVEVILSLLEQINELQKEVEAPRGSRLPVPLCEDDT